MDGAETTETRREKVSHFLPDLNGDLNRSKGFFLMKL